MKKYSVSAVFVFSCFLFGFSILGCDAFSSIKESLSGPKESATAPAVTSEPQQLASVETPQPSEQAASVPLSGNILAQAGSWTLTIDEFNERLKALKEAIPDFDVENKDVKQQVLDELVRQQLLLMDAESSGVAKQKDIVEAVNEFRKTVIVREVARKLVEGIKVSDEEAKAFYEEQKVNLVEPTEYHIRQIVVADQVKANEVLVEVLKGTDFAEMAKQHSVAKDAATNGGDLGFLSEAPFPEMATAVLALKAGDVSNVFKGPDGFYIVKLEEKRGGGQIPFEELKEEIIQNRTAVKQQQAVLDYIKKLEEKVKVEINKGLL